jgi:DNA-binding transcriptional MocR family regulator
MKIRPHGPLAVPTSPNSLAQVLQRQIESGELRAGARLRSLRHVSEQLGLSRYAVLAAYQELEGLGLVEARHGSGFYVSALIKNSELAHRHAPSLDQLLDTALLIRGFVEPSHLLKCGSGVFPTEWMQDLALHKHVRSVAAQPASNLYDYGTALGHAPLREAIQGRLANRRIACSPDQVILTAGISQGLELVIRGFCHPGDLVFVENPAYYNLFGLLHLSGLRMRHVPRTPDGPDLEVLESLLKQGDVPKVFFLQSLLHNPTGSSLSPAKAHRILLLAEQYDFLIAEDDAYGDLAEEQDLRLASLDGLRRVIYLSGFTKTLSASLRVGFAVAGEAVVEALGRAKLLTSITSSEFVERVIYRALTAGGYDRFTATLRQRLQSAQERWQSELRHAGWQVFPGERRGLFVWAHHPRWEDSVSLAKAAATEGFWLAPGSAFEPDHAVSPWVRFNVAYRSSKLTAWLKHPG